MFQRAITFLTGLLCGAVVSTVVPWVLRQKGGKGIRRHWQAVLQASAQAAELRRQELHQQLLSLTTNPKDPTSH
jgi:gas vesicle protein